MAATLSCACTSEQKISEILIYKTRFFFLQIPLNNYQASETKRLFSENSIV
ncbi:hypothetical protein RHECNPAF_1260047 [Rhizobium etli CNPAF512]|nr:hypothetical protein RHECNPAF_1260047 [Rhizobium etli CNPAF512]